MRENAERFALEMTNTLRLVSADDSQSFNAALSKNKQGKYRVSVSSDSGFPLCDTGKTVFLLEARWSFVSGSSIDWMRAESSAFAVFSTLTAKAPLFRYEFSTNHGFKIPEAHIHFHGHEDGNLGMERVGPIKETLSHTGENSKRARKRGREANDPTKRQPQVSDLHFPVGGTRFRPVLEDILLMLIEEYGIDTTMSVDDVTAQLHSQVFEWRKKQLASAIRDMPEVALSTIEDMGFSVVPPPTGIPEGRKDRFTKR